MQKWYGKCDLMTPLSNDKAGEHECQHCLYVHHAVVLCPSVHGEHPAWLIPYNVPQTANV